MQLCAASAGPLKPTELTPSNSYSHPSSSWLSTFLAPSHLVDTDFRSPSFFDEPLHYLIGHVGLEFCFTLTSGHSINFLCCFTTFLARRVPPAKPIHSTPAVLAPHMQWLEDWRATWPSGSPQLIYWPSGISIARGLFGRTMLLDKRVPNMPCKLPN